MTPNQDVIASPQSGRGNPHSIWIATAFGLAMAQE